jgi:hypothetical protein
MYHHVARPPLFYVPLSTCGRHRFLSPGLRNLHYKDSHLRKRALYSLGEYLREPDITIKLRAPPPDAADDEPLTLASINSAASSLVVLLLSRAIHREAYCRAFGRSILLISSRSGRSLGFSSLTLHYKDRNLCNVPDRLSFTLRERVTWPWIALSTDGAPKNIPLKAAWCWTMLQFVSTTAPFLRADLSNPKVVSIRRCVFWCCTSLRRAFALVASTAAIDTSEINP